MMIKKELFLVWIGVALFTLNLMGQDTNYVKVDLDTLFVGESKSGYDDIDVHGGPNSVDADLRADDIKNPAWIRKNLAKKVFDNYYDVKRFLKKKYNLALGTDYMFLNQWASFSFSDRQASSGIFRFYTTWLGPFKRDATSFSQGSLIFKVENRHGIGSGVLPRNLGYEAGAALSTASFKEFQWGITNLYWKQHLYYQKYTFIVGIMDAGDWLDLYPLLNPYKYYLNEAFFNSPAMALPNQGLGAVVGIKRIISHFYLTGGIHDANGQPDKFLVDNFRSFFQNREYMYWVEAGWNRGTLITDGESIHLMYWHQDAKTAEVAEGEEVDESWGLSFSSSKVFNNRYTAFLRAGFAEGNGATMRQLIMVGLGMKVVRHDYLGIGLHWGGPNDRSRRNQFGLEVFYAIQVTNNLNIMPDIQLTFNPSFNDEKNLIGIYSVCRVRYAL